MKDHHRPAPIAGSRRGRGNTFRAGLNQLIPDTYFRLEHTRDMVTWTVFGSVYTGTATELNETWTLDEREVDGLRSALAIRISQQIEATPIPNALQETTLRNPGWIPGTNRNGLPEGIAFKGMYHHSPTEQGYLYLLFTLLDLPSGTAIRSLLWLSPFDAPMGLEYEVHKTLYLTPPQDRGYPAGVYAATSTYQIPASVAAGISASNGGAPRARTLDSPRRAAPEKKAARQPR
ncbi:MAG: hypothetical protein R3F14_06730 [Polyangiaceae bacterium]